MSNVLSLDTETLYRKKDLSVSSLGNYAYTRHPEFDPYLISVCDGTETWAGPPRAFNWDAIRDKHLVSHNAAFDSEVVEAMIERGLAPRIPILKWSCTANMTSALSNRRSLADAWSFFYGEKVDKTARDALEGKVWKDLEADPALMARSLEYARLDAWRCWKLWTDLSPRWSPFEQQISEHTMLMTRRGFPVDVKRATRDRDVLNQALFALRRHMPWIEDGMAPTSPKAIAEKCREAGIPCPPVKSHDGGEEAFIAWEETYASLFPFIQAVTRWRSITKELANVEALLARIRPDGVLQYGAKYFGAHCVSGDTELLTHRGWVKIKDWNGGTIAQWTPETKKISFLPATPNKFDLDPGEKVLRMDAPYAKGIFTLGHTVPHYTYRGKFRTAAAGALCGRAATTVPISGHLDFSGAIEADQMRLLVAVQADGHWTPPSDGGALIFTLRKTRKIERLETLLTRLEIPYRNQTFPSAPNQHRISISRRDCPAWLSRDRKFFGPWLLDSTPEAREALIEEIQYWDGHTAPTHIEYYSQVRENVQWVATIAHLCGKAMNPREKSASLRETGTTMVMRKHWSVEDFDEPVYCPTTETGYWVYRSGGQIGITGNTGRLSGENGFNMFNLRKVPLYFDEQFEWIEPKDDGDPELPAAYAVDARARFVPPPGHVLGIVDSAQIEPRVTHWLAGNTPFLDRIRGGLEIYEAFARSVDWYNQPEELKGNKPYEKIRKTSKACVIGGGYGIGPGKFKGTAKKLAGLDVTDEESAQIIAQYRAANPQIVGLWDRLTRDFESSVGGNYELELPSGRSLMYRDVRRERVAKRDKKTGVVSFKWSTTAEIDGRRYSMWGGSLTENAVQAISRDIFMHQTLLVEKSVGPVLLHVYDEDVCALKIEDANERLAEMVRIHNTAPDWAPGLPLGTSARLADFYLKD